MSLSIHDGREEVISMAKPQYRPGQKAPKSGQYPLLGPQGASRAPRSP